MCKNAVLSSTRVTKPAAPAANRYPARTAHPKPPAPTICGWASSPYLGVLRAGSYLVKDQSALCVRTQSAASNLLILGSHRVGRRWRLLVGSDSGRYPEHRRRTCELRFSPHRIINVANKEGQRPAGHRFVSPDQGLIGSQHNTTHRGLGTALSDAQTLSHF